MIILRNKTFSFPIPFKNTFKYLGKAGNSLIHGKVKEAGKNGLNSVKNATEGTGKLVLGAAGSGVLGASIISDNLENIVNDRTSYIKNI